MHKLKSLLATVAPALAHYADQNAPDYRSDWRSFTANMYSIECMIYYTQSPESVMSKLMN